MNIAKLQTEVVKSLATQNRGVAYSEDGDDYLITSDGFSAFRISKKQCYIDMLKVRKLDALKGMFELTKKMNIAKLSKLRIASQRGVLVKIDAGNYDVWAQQSIFGRFYDEQEIYCEGSALPVRLVNPVTQKVDAIVLPVRISSDYENV